MMRSLVSSKPSTYSNQPEEKETGGDEKSQEMIVAAGKRSKTNSERGRAFRARRKKYEDDLVTIINSLRQEVADLGFLRSVRADKALRSRNSLGGSLVRLAREYFSLFEHELQFGGVLGPKALLDQWKRYTSYHESINVEVVGIEVSGEEDNPMVTVRSDLRVVFSRATFEHVFPHVAHNEDLVHKFVGREVVYHGVNRFHFSSKGQILVYDSDVGFVDALVNAGATISDIALLMQQARIADECRLGDEGNNNDRVHELQSDYDEPVEIPEDNSGASDGVTDADSEIGASSPSENGRNNEFDMEDPRPPERSRFAIDFLLS
ncbi:hypothetical protein BBJ29_000791 [Phytophthora kernoviae]|uniref:BZIP domain-containing protein n=1 Tax=Phytophthora kernoviae TaxID=325452 RepID=A0A3F2S147_9STRA|nr:hypothetical protein BBJ29_000791 [Phytophthora kernoviae]RLN68298.1 hypothetical protein BBP00_00001087 [Phytophthora kernoviae]